MNCRNLLRTAERRQHLRLFLFELDEGAAEVLRVEEEDRFPVGPDLRIPVTEHPGSRLRQPCRCSGEVLHFGECSNLSALLKISAVTESF